MPEEEEETAEGKKSKKIPSALFIPKEINSLYGDRSIVVSTANVDADLASVHEAVEDEELVSPLKEPQSAKVQTLILVGRVKTYLCIVTYNNSAKLQFSGGEESQTA